ncbi:MAG: MFS transporter [Coriobacteriia bacterium]|nr:MFS transporter [Coriobacteriia bacterium]
MAGVLLAMLLGALDGTIVGPAMPKIVQDLGGMALLSWVFTIYSLTSTIAIPIIGKLSDLYGRKWFYLVGIAVFMLGSGLSGTSGEPWMNSIFTTLTGDSHQMIQLIVFRGLQGIGGGMMMANGMAIIGDMFDSRERGRYQGVMGAAFGFASVFGPAIGGWLTDSLSWHWIFLVNIPIGFVALGVLAATLPKAEHGQNHRIDWWGATALTAGVVPLLLALNWGGSEYAWNSRTILLLFAAAFVALTLFVLREAKASEPILDIRLFRDRGFSASMIVLFLSGVGMFGSIMFLPTFMQIVQGGTASSSGVLLTPMMIGMIVASVSGGQIISSTGRYKRLGIGGLAVATVGLFLLSRLTVDAGNLAVVLPMVMVGAGIGVTMPLFTISLQAQFQDRIGEVTGAMQFFRSIGGTMGVALLGGVMNASMRTDLMSRIGDKGLPQLQTLWATGAQPGPFSAEGLKAMVAALGDKIPNGAESIFTDFVGGLKTVVDGGISESFDPSGLLNVSLFEVVGGVVAKVQGSLPAATASQLHLTDVWATLVLDLKLALTSGVTSAFFYAGILMALAFVGMWFVAEVPLHGRAHLATAEEVGAELLVEEAMLAADDEPVIVDVPGHQNVRGEVAGDLPKRHR